MTPPSGNTGRRYVAWVEFFPDEADRVALMGVGESVLSGEPLPPNVPGPEACVYR